MNRAKRRDESRRGGHECPRHLRQAALAGRSSRDGNRALQVAESTGGNGAWVTAKIEDLERHPARIVPFTENGREGAKSLTSGTRLAAIQFVHVNVAAVVFHEGGRVGGHSEGSDFDSYPA